MATAMRTTASPANAPRIMTIQSVPFSSVTLMTFSLTSTENKAVETLLSWCPGAIAMALTVKFPIPGREMGSRYLMLVSRGVVPSVVK